VWIGDRLSDLEPATAVGGRGILVLTGEGDRHRAAALAAGFEVAADLGAAAALVADGAARR
jgi:histidinol phosphatase-like enzyme